MGVHRQYTPTPSKKVKCGNTLENNVVKYDISNPIMQLTIVILSINLNFFITILFYYISNIRKVFGFSKFIVKPQVFLST